MEADLTTQDTIEDAGQPETPETILDHLHPDLLDLAYTALADALEQHVEAQIAAEQAAAALKVSKARMWDTVTADCKNDGQRDRAMTLAFQDAEITISRFRHAEMQAELEVKLAKLEVERNKALYAIAGYTL